MKRKVNVNKFTVRNQKMPKIVMFPHSMKEYSPKPGFKGTRGLCNWNATTDHFRRFLLSKGEYVDASNVLQSGDLLFWTEWEACTCARKLLPKSQHCASWLHEPIYPTACPPTAGGGCLHRQNTDPCVFGKSFKYALCRQYRNGIPTELQDLETGSLIVFCGRKDGTFYLDTVFVVGEQTSYVGPDRKRPQAVHCSNAYRILTLDQTQGKLSFYRGVTWTQRMQHNDIYSFAPGKVLRGCANLNTVPVSLRNRCDLNRNSINRIINNPANFFNVNNWRAAKCMDASPNLVQRVWNELLRQVRANGFVPCVHFPWPPQNQTPNRMAHAAFGCLASLGCPAPQNILRRQVNFPENGLGCNCLGGGLSEARMSQRNGSESRNHRS